MSGQAGALEAPSPSAETAACLERLTKLRNLLAASAADGAVITRPEHVRYLAGWSSGAGPATLVVAGPDAFLVAPHGSVDAARCEALGIEVVAYVPYDAHRLIDPVAAERLAVVGLIRRVGLRGRIGTELDTLPAGIAVAIAEFDPVDVATSILGWRRVKDGDEQLAIRRSVAVLDHAFRQVRPVIRAGACELDVFEAAASAVTVAAGSPVRLDCNLGSGPRSALDDPHQTDRKLDPGDVVLLDLYPGIDGYVADLTRNFVVGTPTSEQLDRHDALESALAAGERYLRPGVPAREIDRAVRDELHRRMPEAASSMTHHAGHGIGLAPWEEPWLGRESAVILEVGMAVAIEPGLYLRGVEGMRLEGNYLVSADGPERLDTFPSALIECPS